MPTKPSPAPRRSARKQEDKVEIVVRRGATRRFDAMKTRTADLGVEVSWDRRATDRRAAEGRTATMQVPRNRRESDRRQKMPFTWDLADFVVVQRPAERKAADKKRAKKV